jgi:hypothetical protein
MTSALICMLNRVAISAPDIVIALSLAVILLQPRLRVLHFPGLVVAKRKVGTR